MTQTQGANMRPFHCVTLPHTRHLINTGQKAARKTLNPGSICPANLGVRECVPVFSCLVDVYKILIRLCILEQKWKYVFFSFFPCNGLTSPGDIKASYTIFCE